MRTVTALALTSALLASHAAGAAEPPRPKAKAAAGPATKNTAADKEARAFLEAVTGFFVPLYTVSSEAAWTASTDVTPVPRARLLGRCS